MTFHYDFTFITTILPASLVIAGSTCFKEWAAKDGVSYLKIPNWQFFHKILWYCCLSCRLRLQRMMDFNIIHCHQAELQLRQRTHRWHCSPWLTPSNLKRLDPTRTFLGVCNTMHKPEPQHHLMWTPQIFLVLVLAFCTVFPPSMAVITSFW